MSVTFRMSYRSNDSLPLTESSNTLNPASPFACTLSTSVPSEAISPTRILRAEPERYQSPFPAILVPVEVTENSVHRPSPDKRSKWDNPIFGFLDIIQVPSILDVSSLPPFEAGRKRSNMTRAMHPAAKSTNARGLSNVTRDNRFQIVDNGCQSCIRWSFSSWPNLQNRVCRFSEPNR